MKVIIACNRNGRQQHFNKHGIQNMEFYSDADIESIKQGFDTAGIESYVLEADFSFKRKVSELINGKFDEFVVFNIAYGLQGNDRYVHMPAILEMMGLPYTGSTPLAHAIALNKIASKSIFTSFDIPTPSFKIVNDVNDTPTYNMPVIVKPSNDAASLGLELVKSQEELNSAVDYIVNARKQDAIIDEFIEGREFNVGVFESDSGLKTLPVIEIVFEGAGDSVYYHSDKKKTNKLEGRKVYRKSAADISYALSEKAQELALRAFKALGIRDHCRVDFRMDDNGNLYALEINSLPSIYKGASYPAAAEQAGIEYSELLQSFVTNAYNRFHAID